MRRFSARRSRRRGKSRSRPDSFSSRRRATQRSSSRRCNDDGIAAPFGGDLTRNIDQRRWRLVAVTLLGADQTDVDVGPLWRSARKEFDLVKCARLHGPRSVQRGIGSRGVGASAQKRDEDERAAKQILQRGRHGVVASDCQPLAIDRPRPLAVSESLSRCARHTGAFL